MNHILLIDDEEPILRAISSRINHAFSDCSITSASNFYRAKAALEGYRNNHTLFDLIISDLHMPREGLCARGDQPNGAVLNGWVFLRDYIVKDDAQYRSLCKDTQIIIFSAFLKELKDYENKRDEDRLLLANIKKVQKGNIYCGQGGYDKLMEVVEAVLQA